ncbi:NAD-dependent epimerase/dehydratase [Bacillus phage Wes44]|uniref:NAD-dependent epimerase/dehydratase n=1 Tax=Bacillus phage Wes44 TaxID=2283012 RepID=A0A346FK18_9CAUD|nr:NAD-dependent epimerase/dehydratase [Bacillus phage Wes44]AXN58323.1 NAD-dependent epimerase/dehydratase [Bacillus phage Wes44]
MLVRFHLSTGAILDKDVPNMNDIGHVANTLAKYGRVYIDDFKGAVLKEHVVYMEEAPQAFDEQLGPLPLEKLELIPAEELAEKIERRAKYLDSPHKPGGIIGEHYPYESIHTSHFEPQDNEPLYHREREQWHPGRS